MMPSNEYYLSVLVRIEASIFQTSPGQDLCMSRWALWLPLSLYIFPYYMYNYARALNLKCFIS